MRGGYKNLAILRFNLIDSPFGIIGVEIKAIAVDKKPVIPASRLGPVFLKQSFLPVHVDLLRGQLFPGSRASGNWKLRRSLRHQTTPEIGHA